MGGFVLTGFGQDKSGLPRTARKKTGALQGRSVPFHIWVKKLLSVTNISNFPYEFSQKRKLWATKQEGSPILLYVIQILVPRKLLLKNILKIFCWSCHMESYFGGLQARKTWTESSSSIRGLLWGLAGKGEGWRQLSVGGWERLNSTIDCVTVYNYSVWCHFMFVIFRLQTIHSDFF